jgi:Helix-turn-helix domain
MGDAADFPGRRMFDVVLARFIQPPSPVPGVKALPPVAPMAAEPLQVVLGRRLRCLRVERGLSCKIVAARLRLPVKLIERHEQGTGRIQPHQLLAYARLFDIRISGFFRDPPAAGNA